MPSEFDVLLIGAGHNGLVAAAVLARAGLRVSVLERRHVVGGTVVTEELAQECGPQWQGVGVHTGAYVCSLLHPTLIEQLELKAFGLELYRREPSSLALFPNGRHLLFHPEAERTRAELERFCPEEIAAYSEFMQAIERACDLIEPFLLQEAKPIETVIASAPNADERAFLTMIFQASARALLDSRFRSDELKAVLATDGVIGTNGGPSTPGTAYVLLHHYLGRAMGARGEWGYVRGGMGALTRALADCVRAHGGEVRVDAAVQRIEIERGRVVGLTLCDGTRLHAATILSNADADTTFRGLMDGPGHLPSDFVPFRSTRPQGVSAKINLLVSEPPRFEAVDLAAFPSPGTVHFVPSMDYLDQAWEDAQRGTPSRVPMVECTIQSLSDPTVTREGRHVVSVFAQYYPYQLAPGLDHEREREAFADRVVDILYAHAPNVRGALVARHVSTPRELEARFGLPGGHIFHGDLLPGNIFEHRCGARTPLTGLYLCGSAAHPGGCVSGMPGWIAAHAVLKDLGRGSG